MIAGPLPARFLEYFSRLGLFTFAFGYVGGLAPANIGLGILLMAFLGKCICGERQVLQDHFVRLAMLWLIVALALAAWGAWLFPAVARSQYSSLPEVWSFAFIPLVALATRGKHQLILPALLVALFGLTYRLVRDVVLGVGPPDHYDLVALGVGRNLAVLFIDVGAVGCLVLLFALVESRTWRGLRRLAASTLCLLILAALLYAWIAAASRTSLVALPLAFAALIAGRLLGAGGRRIAVVGLMLAAAFAALIVAYDARILGELQKDSDTWAAIAAGQWDTVPQDTATGLRFHMWHLAWDNWVQHPLTGLGPSATHLLRSDPSRAFLAVFNQYHSGYVELLLRTGLIGLSFYLVATVLVWRAALRARAAGHLPRSLFELLVAGFAIFVALNFTNAILFFQQGWQFIVLFGGIAYGYTWAERRPANADTTS